MARLMRRTLPAVMLCSTIWVANAGAAPQVSLTVHAVPIRGVPRTGNHPGAGATLEIHVAITGTEYGGYPPPLTHMDLTLPRGMRWSTQGFPTCNWTPFEPHPGGDGGPCYNNASTTPSKGAASVAFGQTILPEAAVIETWYDTEGAQAFVLYGHEPTILELFSEGTVDRLSDGRQRFIFPVPLIETVPNADYASLTSLTLMSGSARPLPRGHAYSLRMPARCRGSLTYALQASFAGPTPASVSTTYSARCPRHYS